MFKKVDSSLNFPESEKQILEFWQKNNIFEKSLQQREGKESFVFFEGPPTANGMPGIHHIVGRSYKDAICRYQTMNGKYVSRKAGWDTHGLPVEIEVEKKLGISGKPQIENIVEGDKRASIQKFNELCRESVWKYKNEWEKMTERMGYWVDTTDPYITYDPRYIESVWWVLKQIWDKGLVYLGHKVVPYCPRCGTSLSSHEVAQGYDEVEDISVYVKFKVLDKDFQTNLKLNINNENPIFILSWTTTPWTLPGNVALAVGNDINYVVVEVGEENWILAEDRLSVLEQADYKKLHTLKGSELVGLEYHPLFVAAIPDSEMTEKAYHVYPADFVNTQDGTGVVHTAVMYGEDDYKLGESVGLPKYHTVDENGHFLPDISDVGGMYVKSKKAETAIFAHLEKNGFLIRTEPHTHTYPFCWRCKSPLLYYARNSWYIKMSELRDKLLENNQQIKWVPEHTKEGRFGEWLKEVKDWAISRERYWGTPLPFWKCDSCGEYKVVSSLDELGVEGIDPHRPFIDDVLLHCDECGGDAHRVSEVLDVWFDSGAMPFAQWHYPFENKEKIDDKQQFPANYIAEAIDQTRGWFYTLLAVSTAQDLGPSYLSCVCHGHVLDEKGQKMSKSKGNVVDPFEMFEKHGSDAIRWYFYSVNQPGDNKLFIQDDLVVSQRKTFGILWNVLNYFVTYANDSGWEYRDSISPDDAKNSPNILDNWLVVRLQKCINDVTRFTNDLNMTSATRAIEDFVQDFSTWYLRRSRGRDDKHFFASMYRTLIYTSKILAPFAPFFAENLYSVLNDKDGKYPESVHLSDWPAVKTLSVEDLKLLEDMESVRSASELGNALRKMEGVKVRQPLASMQVLINDTSVSWNEKLFQVLLDELNIKEIKQSDISTWNKAGQMKVGINFTLTEDLKKEGDIREIERAIQNLRKNAGLNVGEQAKLYYSLTNETLINNLDLKRLSVSEVENKKIELENQIEVELNNGSAWLAIEKIN